MSYPDGYRGWMHVKSAFMGPEHPGYGQSGGFHHIYANDEAVSGYRTGEFPDGSVLVFDWLEARDSAGMFQEGPRRRLDVMLKDTRQYAATGGWGFERFNGESRTERAATAQCFACHEKLKKDDLVLSALRE